MPRKPGITTSMNRRRRFVLGPADISNFTGKGLITILPVLFVQFKDVVVSDEVPHKIYVYMSFVSRWVVSTWPWLAEYLAAGYLWQHRKELKLKFWKQKYAYSVSYPFKFIAEDTTVGFIVLTYRTDKEHPPNVRVDRNSGF